MLLGKFGGVARKASKYWDKAISDVDEFLILLNPTDKKLSMKEKRKAQSEIRPVNEDLRQSSEKMMIDCIMAINDLQLNVIPVIEAKKFSLRPAWAMLQDKLNKLIRQGQMLEWTGNKLGVTTLVKMPAKATFLETEINIKQTFPAVYYGHTTLHAGFPMTTAAKKLMERFIDAIPRQDYPDTLAKVKKVMEDSLEAIGLKKNGRP